MNPPRNSEMVMNGIHLLFALVETIFHIMEMFEPGNNIPHGGISV